MMDLMSMEASSCFFIYIIKGMKVILGISLLLLVVFCNQNHGSSHETRSQEKVRELKLLERIEEILEKRENEESTALQQARQDVEEALEEGDLKLERLMKIQKEKKGQGNIDVLLSGNGSF